MYLWIHIQSFFVTVILLLWPKFNSYNYGSHSVVLRWLNIRYMRRLLHPKFRDLILPLYSKDSTSHTLNRLIKISIYSIQLLIKILTSLWENPYLFHLERQVQRKRNSGKISVDCWRVLLTTLSYHYIYISVKRKPLVNRPCKV